MHKAHNKKCLECVGGQVDILDIDTGYHIDELCPHCGGTQIVSELPEFTWDFEFELTRIALGEYNGRN